MTAMVEPLSDERIDAELADLAGWARVGNLLEKTFTMADFSEALGFIVRVGIEAERLNHHPEITNVWSRVTLRLSTHDAGNMITELDVKLASAVERVAS